MNCSLNSSTYTKKNSKEKPTFDNHNIPQNLNIFPCLTISSEFLLT
jgi:hypothetical protein